MPELQQPRIFLSDEEKDHRVKQLEALVWKFVLDAVNEKESPQCKVLDPTSGMAPVDASYSLDRDLGIVRFARKDKNGPGDMLAQFPMADVVEVLRFVNFSKGEQEAIRRLVSRDEEA